MKNSVVTKYYFAGATRIAVRTNGTLSYLLSDHLGSSSVTTDANGAKTATALYKAFGETRYTLGNLGTDYKFTGQRLQAELGIYWFQSRWMDPLLGRFTSPDTIVPTSTQGTQAWDRYAFVNNNPVRYTDPTGHGIGWQVTLSPEQTVSFLKQLDDASTHLSHVSTGVAVVGTIAVTVITGLMMAPTAGIDAPVALAIGAYLEGLVAGVAYGYQLESEELADIAQGTRDLYSVLDAESITVTFSQETPYSVATLLICTDDGFCNPYDLGTENTIDPVKEWLEDQYGDPEELDEPEVE